MGILSFSLVVVCILKMVVAQPATDPNEGILSSVSRRESMYCFIWLCFELIFLALLDSGCSQEVSRLLEFE